MSRAVWDGDQLLVDIRYPETASEKDVGGVPNPQLYGRVAYVHGGEIDRPLALLRMEYGTDVIIPHRNHRGLFDTGTCLFGGMCSEIEWPAKTMTAYMEVAAARDTGAANWFGSLIEEKQDGSGLRYMRNRYYDPQTGRFTQEDPIGLAGGLNVYGFANGDPVNFSDPYGLCPIEKDGIPCTVTMAGQAAVAGTAAGALYGAAGGTLVVPVFGTIAGAAGGAVVGGLAGLAAGSAVGAAADLSSALEKTGLGSKIRRLITGILIGTGGGMSEVQEEQRRGGAKPPVEQTAPERPKPGKKKPEQEGGEPPKETP